MMKRCTKCGEEKPDTSEFFYVDRGKLRRNCRTCQVDAQRERNAKKRLTRVPKVREPRPVLLVRRCQRCGVEKPSTGETFATQKYGDGLKNTCRNCVNAYSRIYNARNREAVLASSRAYYSANRDHYLKLRRDWTAKNYARQRANIAAWNAAHPDKILQYAARRLQRVRDAEGTHTREDIARILAEQHGRCLYCQKLLGERFQIDHKTPLARGGTNWPSNIACACRACNTRKRTRTLDEFFTILAEERLS